MQGLEGFSSVICGVSQNALEKRRGLGLGVLGIVFIVVQASVPIGFGVSEPLRTHGFSVTYTDSARFTGHVRTQDP